MSEVANAAPQNNAYAFPALPDALVTVGEYRLEYTLSPCTPQHPPLTASVNYIVTPGPAASMLIEVGAVQACTHARGAHSCEGVAGMPCVKLLNG